MGRLVYTAITSLDGYVNDADGGFAWAMPDAQVHQHANDGERAATTHLYGRRLYEVMSYWADPPHDDLGDVERDYAAIWQAADKVVYSTSLPEVATPRTRLARAFDAAEVGALVEAAEGEVSIGGPVLAGAAFAAGLVDEVRLYVYPVAVGRGGTPWVGRGVRFGLQQRELLRFDSGVVFARYAVR